MSKRAIYTTTITAFLIVAFMSSLSPYLFDQELLISDDALIMDTQAVVETTPISTATDGWFSREIVKTDIEFNPQLVDFDSVTYDPIYDDSYNYWFSIARANSYTDDELTCNWGFRFSSTETLLTSYIYVRIYCGGAGTLTNELKASVDGTAYTTESALSENIASAMLDTQGYLNVYWYFVVQAAANLITVSFGYVNPSTYSYMEFYNLVDVNTAFTGCDCFYLHMDTLKFERTTIENNVCSEYQYVSDTVIMHKLIILSFSYAKEINVYAPTHWTYSSINPSATVSTVGSDHTITSPTDLTYTMFFISTSTYLLAIEDVSTDYLYDVGFERYTLDDYSSTVLSPDTLQIVNNISSEGYMSAMMEQAQVIGDYWSHRKIVTISNDYSTCANYVAYVRVVYESEMQADFDDIRFSSSGDVALDFELESKVDSSLAHYWVNIGTASAGNNNIYMYYGKNDASYGGDTEGTWSGTPFEMVHHFEETAGTVYDSTSGNYDLTVVSVDQTFTGMVGNGYDFSGSSSYLYQDGSDLFQSLSAFSITYWGDYDVEGDYGGIISSPSASHYIKGADPLSDSFYWTSSDGTPETDAYSSGNIWTDWDMITLTWDGTNVYFWLNDVYKGSSAHTTGTSSSTGQLSIGYEHSNGYYFDGKIDEIRVSHSKIDDDYIKLNWDLIVNQLTEVTFASATEGSYLPTYTYTDINFNLDLNYNGELYAYFDYYLISGSHISDVRFYYYTNDEWNYESFSESDDLLTDRWIRQFVSFPLLGTDTANTRNVYVEFIDFEGTVYLDNIKFFQVSTEIDTVNLDEYEISSSFISWDGYQNPTVENEYIYSRLLDRTERNDNEGSSEGYTDSNGVFTWTFEGSLTQKEYEVMSYAKNSWWMCPWTPDYLKDADNWDHSNYGTVTKTITDEYALFHNVHLDTHTAEYYYLESPDPLSDYWDFSENNIILFDFKTISNTELDAIIIRSLGWSQEVLVRYVSIYDQLDWLSIDFWFDRTACFEAENNDNPNDDLDSKLDFDTTSLTEIKYIHFTGVNATNTATDFYVRNVHVTRAISFYFTPSYPYNIELDADGDSDVVNYLDYSEYTVENDDSTLDVDSVTWEQVGSVNITNGYLTWLKDNQRYYTYTQSDLDSSIDYDEYCYVIMRVWCNESGHDIQARWINPTSFGESIGVTVANTWVICQEDLSLDPYWAGYDGQDFGVMINNIPTTPYQALEIRVDYVRLVHVEEPETYLTNTYLGFGSENDKWISAVYSDDIFLGYYNDP
ncbi:MAG: DUF2341 domain-containing protein, partial [Candidatus Heimdallarchaeota archaeon]